MPEQADPEKIDKDPSRFYKKRPVMQRDASKSYTLREACWGQFGPSPQGGTEVSSGEEALEIVNNLVYAFSSLLSVLREKDVLSDPDICTILDKYRTTLVQPTK